MRTRWRVEKIPILKDNFVFVIHDGAKALVVDPGEAAPVIEFLTKQNLRCERVLLTHHHSDHIGGVDDLIARFPCPAEGPQKNLHQIHNLSQGLREGDRIQVDELRIEVWEVPGHTLGHIAFWLPEQKWLFSGDVLFALGCGRLFEGTPEQMFATLQRIKSLPDETLVFCTHDYYPSNKNFADRENLNVSGYEPIHPLLLGQEKELNPFLKAQSPAEFASLRKTRDLY